jgi:predicted acyltransferase
MIPILPNSTTTPQQRNDSLDVLRGIAILLMVLSSSISFGNLPAWMYHAQVPPPKHLFDPSIAGITWVDLVFPIFLFTMGAAIPLAMRKKVANLNALPIVGTIFKRFVALFFFALFSFYMRAWVMSGEPAASQYILSIVGFVLLFALYADLKSYLPMRTARLVHVAALLLSVGMLYLLYAQTDKFTLEKTDIIILVLANMALFGTLWWWLTAKSMWLRMAILPFIMGVFLGAKEVGSINEFIYKLSPATWLYQFYYLKYLFIILPATVVGEWIIADRSLADKPKMRRSQLALQGLLCAILIGLNVFNLYMRYLDINIGLTLMLIFSLCFCSDIFRKGEVLTLQAKMAVLGSYLLFLGLIFEAYEGGIKKDYSTYSYYFVSTCLACYALTMLCCIEKLAFGKSLFRGIALVGKNPMVAYTAGNLVLIPLLALTGLQSALDQMGAQGVFGGVMRGVLFTGIVALLTIVSSRLKLYWKS